MEYTRGKRRLKDIYLSVEEMTKRNNGLHPVTHGRHVENGSKKNKKTTLITIKKIRDIDNTFYYTFIISTAYYEVIIH